MKTHLKVLSFFILIFVKSASFQSGRINIDANQHFKKVSAYWKFDFQFWRNIDNFKSQKGGKQPASFDGTSCKSRFLLYKVLRYQIFVKQSTEI